MVTQGCSRNNVPYIDFFQLVEDLNVDPEEDSDHFMTLLIESLALLGKIPEAIEVTKHHCRITIKMSEQSLIMFIWMFSFSLGARLSEGEGERGGLFVFT
jgi:hypothetical protein